ncbi:MAG: terminase small subunit [Clostridium sp.]|nr:terminase small subunit [Clostridium tertium]MBS6503486.1 terminase small subunit [Clostridium sp.]
MEKKLTPKQKAFADYYIETGNATESARRAGYKGKNLNRIASENLSKLDIKQYIDERIAKIEDERIAKGEEVLRYLTRVMRGEEKDQFGLDAALQDRTKAAELLGKRYRLFIDKIESENNTTLNSIKKLDAILEQLGEEEE